jgi:two-component system LytT family sensor kinase
LLAAVVVHSVARTLPRAIVITWAAYGSAVAASLLHLRTVTTGDPSSSSLAFTLLTVSFGAIVVLLAGFTRRQPNGPRALWMLGLALFAVSATHLGRFHGDDSPWIVELAGHQAAIPLAFAMLYQDYRFALADLFLKQALTLLALVSVAFAMYSGVVAVLGVTPVAITVLMGLWIGLTLVYPYLRDRIVHFVDAVLLGREDYAVLRASIVQDLAGCHSIDNVLDLACERIATALTARRVEWQAAADSSAAYSTRATRGSMRSPEFALAVPVLTTERPDYVIRIGDFSGGRRLLSDDEELAGDIATIAGRRIDSVRLTSERYELRLREEEMQKLTAEAELRALRAQINPHFLFNALTTIGYLIETSPRRAVDTLLRLTSLLRGVLRSDGDFTTLGREIELVEHYLDIERARFEERLRVRIDVPPALRTLRIPSLVIQPLVENAIKHGIAPSAPGGDVHLRAGVVTHESQPFLHITVSNSGAPLSTPARAEGVGLANVERRLHGHYGEACALEVARTPEGWTVARIELPVIEDFEHGHVGQDIARTAGR